MDARIYKVNLLRVLDEAIAANSEQMTIGAGADDFASYKYMLGISHTLQDMKSRVNGEFKNLFKEETLYDDDK
tara:strand:+ start:553 stop:771 length:219 start_codon:yes stop_codon:yes gene_type:complete